MTRELTKNDLHEFAYWFLGMCSILLMTLTHNFFLLFYVILFLVMYGIHAWMGFQELKIGFRMKKLERLLDQERQKLQDNKFEALYAELKEIKKTLTKKKR